METEPIELTCLGDVDIRKGVPSGWVHRPGVEAGREARTAGLEYYPAMVGVEKLTGLPVRDGVVIRRKDGGEVEKRVTRAMMLAVWSEMGKRSKKHGPTEKQSEASRKNGRLGGRPKKQKASNNE